MNSLNVKGNNLVKEIDLANKFNSQKAKTSVNAHASATSIAFAYEKARNAVEYRDEHLIRLAAIERILKRRLFLNQSSEKVAISLIKELTWARYITPLSTDLIKKDKFKNIIEKYRSFDQLVGLCACEIDETLNFNPINQIIINFVSSTLTPLIDFGETDKVNKSIQIYIAVERSFAKNSETLIKYKLLKVLLPNWSDKSKLLETVDKIDGYLDYKYKDLLRRKVKEMSPPFNLIRDLVLENLSELKDLTDDKEKLRLKIIETLEVKYKDTKNKVLRASKRSIIYLFLSKMLLAVLIEVPFDILLGKLNYMALSINILFSPSLMILFNSNVKLPDSDNTDLMTNKVFEYLYSDNNSGVEILETEKAKGTVDKIFSAIFIITSILLVLGIIYLLNSLSFSFVSQIIFLFFLSVVSFFAFRVREISNDYLLKTLGGESFLNTLLDYIFLPIIKSGQWLSSQIEKTNILSFIFDFIIEAPLKSFLEIMELWLHFVRVKKEEFLS